jgi:hypothetical protein
MPLCPRTIPTEDLRAPRDRRLPPTSEESYDIAGIAIGIVVGLIVVVVLLSCMARYTVPPHGINRHSPAKSISPVILKDKTGVYPGDESQKTSASTISSGGLQQLSIAQNVSTVTSTADNVTSSLNSMAQIASLVFLGAPLGLEG